MSGDILFGFRRSLVGVPPSPGLTAPRPVEHALRRGFALPLVVCFHICAQKLGLIVVYDSNHKHELGGVSGSGELPETPPNQLTLFYNA